MTVDFLELEITTECALACRHCYSKSGPKGDTGTMSTRDWLHVIEQAAALNMETVQFIGGEPTMHPDFHTLAQYALLKGLKVAVYTNLLDVTPELWELYMHPEVTISTSWYSADPAKHAEVTGSPDSFRRTRANIVEALRRGIDLKAGIVEVVDGQGVDEARADLEALGVTDIQIDRARAIGRAARGRAPDISELCGNCGRGRAAIDTHGRLIPCVLGRFLIAGNVTATPLGELLAGQRWDDIVTSVPDKSCVTCTPADSNDCDPSR
ncbi:MAG: radical SAM protein [Streptosporangiales bacterium]|nr:radical SAM protein [Streptosporangiales bacterium]